MAQQHHHHQSAQAPDLDDSDEEELQQVLPEAIIVPPDGGWGWVIVAASFFANVVVDGIIFTVGQGLLPIWKDQFTGGSASTAAWVFSMLSGFYLLVGPIVSALANIFGCRATAMAGAAIASLGFALSMFAKNIYFLYFSFGTLGGIGFGLIYLPSIVIVSYYFEKKRAFATGIAVCGSGIGTFVFAPLINYLLKTNTWQETMLILSGITLQCVVFAAMYRNLAPTKQQVLKIKEKIVDMAEVKEQRKLSQINFNGQTQLPSRHPSVEKAPTDSPFIAGNIQFERFSSPSDEKRRDNVSELPTQNVAGNVGVGGGRTRTISERLFKSAADLDARSRLVNRKTSMALLANGQLDDVVNKDTIAVLNRPLSRMDIFYAGSVKNLPEFQSQPDVKHFIASTMSIPQMMDGGDSTEPGPMSTKASIFSTLKTMLDFSMFTSPSFVVLALSGFFTLTGFFVPFIYLPQMAQEESFGHSEEYATFLVSILGITNILARVLCGWLSDRPQVNALMVNNVALVLAGVATVLVPHFKPYWLLCIYCVIFGMGTACFASLRSVICVELLGLEKLTNAFGLLLLFMGIASLIGSPLAGFLYDTTKSFNVSFYVMGSLVAFSGLMGFPLPYINAWEKRRSKQTPYAETEVSYHAGSRALVPETVEEEDEEEGAS